MARYYQDFIELSPGYESVIDVATETRQKDFWTRYIVNDDMTNALAIITKSLRHEADDDVWHFWLRGNYGTGKTYSALVIKHLLEDDLDRIEEFLKHQLFSDVRDKFLAVRRRGRYIVAWRSGECKQLSTTDRLLLELEKTVRDALEKNNFAYTGRGSLIESVKAKVVAFKGSFREWFDQPDNAPFFAIYADVDEFFEKVRLGDIDACNAAMDVLLQHSVALATDFNTFQNWLQDVFAGNPGLEKTGIFIIWDEFTDYIRNGNDIEILQELSQLSKSVPFFIMYVTHEYPGLHSEGDAKYMSKIDDRFHKINVELKETTTYKLVGESICVKDGMASRWDDVCGELYGTISSKIAGFLPDFDATAEDLKKLFPLHPMSIQLITKLAGNFVASNRTIFRFLKDENADENQAGFRYFLRNFGPDGWKWVTPDFLFDYFFLSKTRDSENKSLTPEAESCVRHYWKECDKITGDTALRVFKGVLLLLATIGPGRAVRKSAGSAQPLKATQNTLVDCFAGQLGEAAIQEYLNEFSEKLEILTVVDDRGDRRIELPLPVKPGELKEEFEKQKRDNPLSALFDKNTGDFGRAFGQLFLQDKAVTKRLELVTCWGQPQQIRDRVEKLEEVLRTAAYKFGVLLVGASDLEGIDKAKQAAAQAADSSVSGRLLVAVLQTPLTEELLNDYFDHKAKAVLALRSNNAANAKSETDSASILIASFVQKAIGSQMTVFSNGSAPAVVSNNSDFMAQAERVVLHHFRAAPERVIKTVTVYKTGGLPVAKYGLTKLTMATKSATDPEQKNFNTQHQNIVDALIAAGVWDLNSSLELMQAEGSTAAKAVAELCRFVDKQLTENATTYLDDLWDSLQSELGYYDVLVCHYLLGFVLRFYIGKFTWHDASNSHQLNADNMARLIIEMCAGRAKGHKIASESDIEKRFKALAKRMFALSDQETADIDTTRKTIRPKISRNEYPFWVLKYLEDDSYRGLKGQIVDIIDKFQAFITETGDQKAVAEDLTALFEGNAVTLLRIITDCYKDKTALLQGVRNFITQFSPATFDYGERYGFSVSNLFDMLGKNLEKEVWQWSEQEVVEKLAVLTLDIRLVGIINDAVSGSAHSVDKIRETLTGIFKYMVVPGCVYETFGEEWSQSVPRLFDLSLNKWVSYSLVQKQELLADIELHAKEAFANIEKPDEVLRKYLVKQGKNLSAPEVDEILEKLALYKEPYGQSENAFKGNIQKIINELEYTRRTRSAKELWVHKTGDSSVGAWLNRWSMPVSWVLPEQEFVFSALIALEQNERIDDVRLENACRQLENIDLGALQDEQRINNCFLANVSSEEFSLLLEPKITQLKKYLREHCGANVLAWQNQIPALRRWTIDFIKNNLQNELFGAAKAHLSAMTDGEVREKVEQLMVANPDICLKFI